MEFIPLASTPAFPHLRVPHFGPKDEVYKASGLAPWLFYPHYQGYNLDQFINGDFSGESWQEAAGLLQRWAYCGMIEEIFTIGGLQGLSYSNGSSEKLDSFFANLPCFLMLWDCIHRNPDDIYAGEAEHECFTKIIIILKRVNQFYSMLCTQEWVR